jgi:hypothetical protein
MTGIKIVISKYLVAQESKLWVFQRSIALFYVAHYK